EIGLAVLHAVFPSRVAALDPRNVEIGLIVLAEDRLYDVLHRLVLKNLAVGGARREPEPGDDFGMVDAEASAPHLGRNEFANDPRKMPLVVLRSGDGPGDRLPEQQIRRDRLPLRNHIETE